MGLGTPGLLSPIYWPYIIWEKKWYNDAKSQHLVYLYAVGYVFVDMFLWFNSNCYCFYRENHLEDLKKIVFKGFSCVVDHL